MSEYASLSPVEIYETAACEHIAKEIAESHVKSSEFEALIEGLLHEPAKIFLIVAYSYIDQRLKELLTLAVNPSINGGPESLFGALGPLGNSSSRIQMAAAMYWLRDSTYRDLTTLRKIRNDFAHDPFISTLGTQRMLDLMRPMFSWETYLADNPRASDDGSEFSDTQKLKVRTICTSAAMIAELVVAPRATRSSLSPFSPLRSKKWFPPAIEVLLSKAHSLSNQVMGAKPSNG